MRRYQGFGNVRLVRLLEFGGRYSIKRGVRTTLTSTMARIEPEPLSNLNDIVVRHFHHPNPYNLNPAMNSASPPSLKRMNHHNAPRTSCVCSQAGTAARVEAIPMSTSSCGTSIMHIPLAAVAELSKTNSVAWASVCVSDQEFQRSRETGTE